jgi:hypothetical protein
MERIGRAVGHEIDRAAGRVAAIERALRPAQHLHPRHVEDQPLGHDRDRVGHFVHIDADRGRIVRGIVLKAHAAQAELRRAAAKGRFDLKRRNRILQLVDVGDPAFAEHVLPHHAQRDAHILRRLFAVLGGDDDRGRCRGFRLRPGIG